MYTEFAINILQFLYVCTLRLLLNANTTGNSRSSSQCPRCNEISIFYVTRITDQRYFEIKLIPTRFIVFEITKWTRAGEMQELTKNGIDQFHREWETDEVSEVDRFSHTSRDVD